MKRAQGSGRRAQGEEYGKLFFILSIIYTAVILLSGCSKDDFPVAEDKDAVGEIQMNTLFNIREISDGFIIAGVSDSKIKISKLDVNFNTVWSKDDFDWEQFFRRRLGRCFLFR